LEAAIRPAEGFWAEAACRWTIASSHAYYHDLHVETFSRRLRSAAAPACAQGDAFAQRFDAVLSQHGVVGGGIAIVHMQEPATQWFFGKARKDTQQPVDEETSYNWASITKTMTAIAILQLRDRGKLSLDDSAVLYVPELRQVHDEFGSIDDITIRDLLT
jgi:CubicO group peptidase (beta-lactamase class C family)